MDTEVDGEIAAWTLDSINKGALGSSTLLTSSITLVKEGETIQVNCLWDSGSESSFFSPALLPFATHQRQASFKIETLSPSATRPVHSIEAAFQVAIPDGEAVQLTLLQHRGLKTRNMKLKAKLLTCPAKVAQANNLKERGLTEACPRDSADHVPVSDRFKYIDDLQLLELVMMAGLLQDYDIFMHVPSDIPLDHKFLNPQDTHMQSYLDQISFWTTQNLMQLNPEKSNYLIFSRAKESFVTRLTVNGTKIDQKDAIQILGCWI